MSTSLPLKLPTDTTFDKIFAWYMDNTGKLKLTEKQELLKLRWEAAFALLCNYHSPQDCIPLLMDQFDIEQAQVYRDIRNATNLFGDVHGTNKQGVRHILYQYSMKIYQLASTVADFQEMNKAIANMIKITGVDKEDPALPDFSRLKPTTQVIALDPEFLDKFGHVIDDKVLDKMRQVMKKNIFSEYKEIIDVPFIDVKDGDKT